MRTSKAADGAARGVAGASLDPPPWRCEPSATGAAAASHGIGGREAMSAFTLELQKVHPLGKGRRLKLGN